MSSCQGCEKQKFPVGWDFHTVPLSLHGVALPLFQEAETWFLSSSPAFCILKQLSGAQGRGQDYMINIVH